MNNDFLNFYDKLDNYLMQFIYPKRCLCCDEILEYNELMCQICKGQLEEIKIQNKIAPYAYQTPIKEAIHEYKFNSCLDKGVGFTILLIDWINENNIMEDVDLISYVPMRNWDEIIRGYNQTQILAEYLSANYKIPYILAARKLKATKKQHDLNQAERQKNLIGAYGHNMEEDITDKVILVVDDVSTTGATQRELTKAILEGGAKQVKFISICKVMGGEDYGIS